MSGLMKLEATSVAKRIAGGLFPSAPAAPIVTPAPPVPTIDKAAQDAQAQADALRRRRGMAANILSRNPAGTLTSSPTTSAATLLGS